MCAVEWKKLWQVTIWDKRFSGIDKKLQPKVIKYHYYLANELKELERASGDVRILYTTEQVAYTDSMLACNNISEGEVVAIPWGGNASVKYFKGKFITADNRIATSSNIAILNNKYLYYWMLHRKDELEGYYRGAGIKHPSMYSVLMMDIPIPPLAKQQEIVSHLDTFTTLISNLESELDMRRKQYEHYRNQLFGDTLELLLEKAGKGEIKVSILSEIGTFTRGRRFVRTDIMTEGTPCIHYGDMYTYYGVSAKITPTFLLPEVAEKLRFAQENDVVIVGAGENNEDIGIGVAWLGNEDVAVHDACYIFKHQMNPLYISYYLRTDIYHKQIKKYVSSGKICSISSDGIGKSIVPIPSLKIQQEIVQKLDAFENLIQSLEQEIKLRKQQYEYYREKLLTFEKE